MTVLSKEGVLYCQETLNKLSLCSILAFIVAVAGITEKKKQHVF